MDAPALPRSALAPALACCATAFALAWPLSAAAANLVQNGSFEDLDGSFVDTAANYMALAAGATAITGWTVSPATAGALVWAQTPTGDAHSAAAGAFFVDLTGFGANSPNGALQQTLQGLVAGRAYSLSMDVEVVGSLPSVTVGATAVSLSAGTPFSVGNDRWTPMSGVFVADAAAPLLKIMNQQPGQQITFIDNVVIPGVPEPATVPLFAAGLGALWATGLRRRHPHSPASPRTRSRS